MLYKPEVLVFADGFGDNVTLEYVSLEKRLDDVDLEAVRLIAEFAYKEGIRDGFLLQEELNKLTRD